MNTTDFTFRLTAYDIDRFLPQVSKALEKRTELLSRQRFPFLWKITDKLVRTSRSKNPTGLHTKLLSLLCLAAGIILLVPGLMKPRELLIPLLAGAIASAIGLWGLWCSRKQKANPFDRSAGALLNGKDTISEEQAMEISFFETAMMLPGGGDDDCVLYEDFQSVFETADLFLLVFDTRAVVLQKRDLTTGDPDAFREFITAHVSQYHSLV